MPAPKQPNEGRAPADPTEAEAAHGARLFRFDAFEVDPQTGELRKNGVKIHLQDQPLHVLIALLERPGQLVTRGSRLRNG